MCIRDSIYSGCWCSRALCISILRFVIWSLVPLPCQNPACLSAISVSVFTRILSSHKSTGMVLVLAILFFVKVLLLVLAIVFTSIVNIPANSGTRNPAHRKQWQAPAICLTQVQTINWTYTCMIQTLSTVTLDCTLFYKQHCHWLLPS